MFNEISDTKVSNKFHYYQLFNNIKCHHHNLITQQWLLLGLHHTARGWFCKVTILHICNICKYLTIFQVCDWGTTCQASPFTFQLKVLIADKKSYQVTNMERLLCKFVFVVFLMEALMNAKTYAGGKKKS